MLKQVAKNIISPWLYQSMTENDFLEKAQTGDILLFRGNRAATALTRALTSSEFDHVGIIVRLKDKDDVYIIEATGRIGVSVNRWSNIKQHIGPSEFYERVIYR